MSLQRIRSQLAIAKRQFPSAELRMEGGAAVVKCPLQTAVGGVYVVKLTFASFPYSMPEAYVVAPSLVSGCPHIYSSDRICLLHPTMWNPAIHDVKFVLMRAAKWLNKYEVWRVKHRWPGAEVKH